MFPLPSPPLPLRKPSKTLPRAASNQEMIFS
ncbi:unnamed protein product, partial [Allacma fusca]